MKILIIAIASSLLAQSPAYAPDRHPAKEGPELTAYWRAVAAYNASAANFQASLTSQQKQLAEQMEEQRKKAEEASAKLCAEGEALDMRSGDPVCVANTKPASSGGQ